MPFKNAYLISFHADDQFTYRASYYDEQYSKKNKKQSSQESFDSTHVHFTTLRPRKLIPVSRIPLCRINFAFDPEKVTGRYGTELLNIDVNKTNKEIGEDKLKTFLENVKPFSVIYIDAHGEKNEESFIQRVFYGRKEDIAKSFISAKYLAEIFGKWIPKRSRNHIQFHLLLCHGESAAGSLMKELSPNFENTSVLCHNGIMYSDHVHNHSEFIMRDFYSERHQIFHDKWRYKNILTIDALDLLNSDIKKLDDKLCIHNCYGYIVKEDYSSFKKGVLRDWSKIDANSSNDLIVLDDPDPVEKPVTIYEQMLLHFCIMKSVEEYIQYTSLLSLNISHGSAGKKRAENFITNMRKQYVTAFYSEQNEPDNKRLQTNYITLLLCELYYFSTNSGDYKFFNSEIGVNDHSLFTFILRGICNFVNSFDKSRPGETSEYFQSFLCVLLRTIISPTTKENIKAELNRLFDANKKSNRQFILNRFNSEEMRHFILGDR